VSDEIDLKKSWISKQQHKTKTQANNTNKKPEKRQNNDLT
jgi:hypothetical protein